MTISKFGAERVQEEGFDDLVAAMLSCGDVDGAKIFVAVALDTHADPKHGRYERNKKGFKKASTPWRTVYPVNSRRHSNSIGGSVRTGIITHSGASPYVSGNNRDVSSCSIW
jgi:hypothetical protein